MDEVRNARPCRVFLRETDAGRIDVIPLDLRMNVGFLQVERFDGFEFREPDAADVRILYAFQAEGREVLARCGSFVVCK